MAGIYLHLPFCKQACTYCNFHFSTQWKQKDDIFRALIREIEWEKSFLQGLTVNTVYFGGGTPSLFSPEEIQRLLDEIHRHYATDLEEVTLEANPDDLSQDYLSRLRSTEVDRLSIGVQSFEDRDLEFMNRAHRADQAQTAIQSAIDLGFEQLSLDLIYGTPFLSDEQWVGHLQRVADWEIPHFSAYALTVEPSTALEYQIRKKKIPPLDPEKMARQFELLQQKAKELGYEHYEISNLARPGHYARHNSAYWNQQPYLGLGPSAHSFRGNLRRWNLAHNTRYLKAMSDPNLPRHESENLSLDDQVNEYLMTSLRTQWGCHLDKIETQWGKRYRDILEKEIPAIVDKGWMENDGNQVWLTESGRLFADGIARDLFVKL